MKLVLPAILSAVSLMLLAGIGYEAVAPLDPVAVETPRLPARHASGGAQASYAPPPEDLFADIDAHPLFSATRQPLADPAQASGAAAASSDFVLVGVIMGGQKAVALLRNKTSAATTSAAVGDLVAGWRVTHIDATTVTMRANGGDFVVPLDGPANRPPSAPLPAAQAPAQQGPLPAAGSPPPISTPAPQTAAVTNPAKPVLPAHPASGTIAPEALKSAPIDPTTGEPTL